RQGARRHPAHRDGEILGDRHAARLVDARPRPPRPRPRLPARLAGARSGRLGRPRAHPRRRSLSRDRKSTRLNSSHVKISYAVFAPPLRSALLPYTRSSDLARELGGTLRTAMARFSAIVTPLGWSMLALVPLALALGYRLGWLELVAVAWAGLVLILVAALYLEIGRAHV